MPKMWLVDSEITRKHKYLHLNTRLGNTLLLISGLNYYKLEELVQVIYQETWIWDAPATAWGSE